MRSNGLRAIWPGFDSRQEVRDFSFHSVYTDSETYPFSYTQVSGPLVSGVRRPECKTDHSPPSSVEVKNDGAIPALPSIHLHSVV
jgi:hypothetical protein